MLVNDRGKRSIKDLCSQNGTFVDGKPVQSATLTVGGSIRLGAVTLEVLDRLSDKSRFAENDDATPRAAVKEAADAHLRARRFPPARMRLVRLLLQGYSEKKIAARSDVTRHTIDWHVKAIYKELGVHSRAELSAHFRENETIPLAHDTNAGTVLRHQA